MESPFEAATKAALEDLIQKHAKRSKWGYVMTDEGLEELSQELLNFVLTSRNLKAAGDRFLSGGMGEGLPAARR